MIYRSINRFALALAIAVLLPAVFAASPTLAVYGGHTIANTDGFVVALTHRPSHRGTVVDRAFCTGTLIAPKWVLTAAHCLAHGTQLRDYEIVLGRTRLSAGGGEIIKPVSQYIQPHYRRSGMAGHDVALIELARPAMETPAPIAAAKMHSQWAPGRTLLVHGWGYTCLKETRACQGDDLQGVDMRVRSDRECLRAVGWINRATEICTRTRRVTLEGGDSGGPGVINTPAGPRLVAVTSWGQADFYGRVIVGGWVGYAEVAGTKLATWIRAVIARHSN